ncbi:hypothetical protein AGLY_010012 [Aphis glycines]|uniref:Uncharacterized protein n=1 Tax=Aphis glycines TaxID=307491 RepID=A0A6G0TGT4_APHGL|nr:hypothetical protein AGLY_010012 [Aphis glycines]
MTLMLIFLAGGKHFLNLIPSCKFTSSFFIKNFSRSSLAFLAFNLCSSFSSFSLNSCLFSSSLNASINSCLFFKIGTSCAWNLDLNPLPDTLLAGRFSSGTAIEAKPLMIDLHELVFLKIHYRYITIIEININTLFPVQRQFSFLILLILVHQYLIYILSMGIGLIFLAHLVFPKNFVWLLNYSMNGGGMPGGPIPIGAAAMKPGGMAPGVKPI